MKKEIEIYVATDIDGMIIEFTRNHYPYSVKLLLQKMDKVISNIMTDEPPTYVVYPITVYSTDGIIGKHYQDVDLFHRRLRECALQYENEGYHSALWDGLHWDITRQLQYLEQTNGGIRTNVCEEHDVCPDIHTALKSLVDLN